MIEDDSRKRLAKRLLDGAMADKPGCGFSLIIVPVLSVLSWLCSHPYPSTSAGKQNKNKTLSQSLRQDGWLVPSLLVLNAKNVHDLPRPQR